jgi:DNA-binding NarL/FixJ family response regulator
MEVRLMVSRVEGTLRVVLAEDSVILRDGMVELLAARGCDVVAAVGTAEDLLSAVNAHSPDVAVVDIRMPPTRTDEGIRAALKLRESWPTLGILIFSQHVETTWATTLLAGDAAGVGYLLKERVAHTADLIDALHRVASGGTVLDPEIVTRLLSGGRRRTRVESLTAREREVLDLMAAGHSNRSIAQRMVITERAVEKHASAIFAKFDLPSAENDNRRVKAVVTYLTETTHL